MRRCNCAGIEFVRIQPEQEQTKVSSLQRIVLAAILPLRAVAASTICFQKASTLSPKQARFAFKKRIDIRESLCGNGESFGLRYRNYIAFCFGIAGCLFRAIWLAPHCPPKGTPLVSAARLLVTQDPWLYDPLASRVKRWCSRAGATGVTLGSAQTPLGN